MFVSAALPTATLTVEPQSPEFTGETVTLKCEIESLSGWTIKWYKDNMSEPVNMTVESKITITGASAAAGVTLSSADRSGEGITGTTMGAV